MRQLYGYTGTLYASSPRVCKALCSGAMYRPDPERHGPGPYPTLVSVYGADHAQTPATLSATSYFAGSNKQCSSPHMTSSDSYR